MTKEENVELQEKERHDCEEQEEGRNQREEEEVTEEEEEDDYEQEDEKEDDKLDVDEEELDEERDDREEEEGPNAGREEEEEEPEPAAVSAYQSPEPRQRPMVHAAAQAPLPRDYSTSRGGEEWGRGSSSSLYLFRLHLLRPQRPRLSGDPRGSAHHRPRAVRHRPSVGPAGAAQDRRHRQRGEAGRWGAGPVAEGRGLTPALCSSDPQAWLPRQRPRRSDRHDPAALQLQGRRPRRG